jgi:hypothetical protein
VRDDDESNEGVSLGQGKTLCKATSNKAIEVQLVNGGQLWIPISCIHDDSEVFDAGHTGNVIVKQWWADDRGLSGPAKKGKGR